MIVGRRSTVAVLAMTLAAGSLAATPAVAAARAKVGFANGTLSIVGTGKADVVVVTRSGKKITVKVNGKKAKLAPKPTAKTLARITMKGAGGNDSLTLVETRGPLPPATLVGADGDDSLKGGSGANHLDGGTGNDSLTGGTGANTALGGDGNDVLIGGPGPNTFDGGPGNDSLTGGTGPAHLDGGSGADALTGGSRPSLLLGGPDADTLVGGPATDALDAGPGADTLTQSPGGDTMAGGTGDDAYLLDADLPGGAIDLVEALAAGSDLVSFAATSTVGVALDLESSTGQAVAPGLGVVLSSGQAFEDATGGSLADTFTGNDLVNTFAGGAGSDLVIHHGAGDGVDIVTDMSSAAQDKVRFTTGGTLSASALTLDATATALRDVATGTFGFDFITPVLAPSSSYTFGTTDGTPAGSLFTFNGTGGFSLGSNADSLVANFVSNGATMGGAGARDRIVDHSPHGNSLMGRDGADVLLGGAGADTLNGERGFDPGVDDILSGGASGDTFEVGRPFTGTAAVTIGNDTITDIETADQVDLFTGLSVKSGLGTAVVTIWDGVSDFGTITAGNGRAWIAGDFV